MEKHFMIDIETTGVDILTDKILQVGVLECEFSGGRWEAGRALEFLVGGEYEPKGEFAKTHMMDLYRKCAEAPRLKAVNCRASLLQFFRSCGEHPPDVYLMGWNASNFDVPFLVEAGFLKAGVYVPGVDGKDIRTGDFHYRIYEIGGAVSLAQNVLKFEDRNALCALAKARGQITIPLPAGKEHDAIYDCYSQLAMLNGFIELCGEARETSHD